MAKRQGAESGSSTTDLPRNVPADLLDDLLTRLADAGVGDPRVLDVGCGDGARTLANLPEGSLGLDGVR